MSEKNSNVCSVYPAPCVKVSERYIYQWVRKLNEELGEAIDAIYTDHRPYEALGGVPLSYHTAEELTDLITVATSLLNAGGYTTRFTLNDTALYQWADGSTAAYKDIPVTIGVVTPTVTPPTKANDMTYNGSSRALTATAGSTNFGTL